MPRALSVSRATVRAGVQAEYVAALGCLAARLRARGDSLWLFRHPTQTETFLEFSESAAPERHHSRATPDPDEAALEVRLRTLATYAADAWILWEEVPLETN